MYGYSEWWKAGLYRCLFRLPDEDRSHVTANTFIGDDTKGIKALEAKEDVTILACPDVLAAYKKWKESSSSTKKDSSDQVEQDAADKQLATVQQAMINHCRDMKDRIVILDMPEDLELPMMRLSGRQKWNSMPSMPPMYFPWIQVPIPASRHLNFLMHYSCRRVAISLASMHVSTSETRHPQGTGQRSGAGGNWSHAQCNTQRPGNPQPRGRELHPRFPRSGHPHLGGAHACRD